MINNYSLNPKSPILTEKKKSDSCFPSSYSQEKKKKVDLKSFTFDSLSDQKLKTIKPFFVKTCPNIKHNKPDSVENITLQIFAHLYSLADRENRKDIEAAIAPNRETVLSSNKTQSSEGHNFTSLLGKWEEEKLSFDNKFNHSYQFPPFKKETNFDSEGGLDRPVRIKNVVRNIFFGIAKLFLGYELLGPEKDLKTSEEMEQILYKDYITWTDFLKKHYTYGFQSKLEVIFRQAGKLLRSRQNDEKYFKTQRITFYALFIISTVGKIVGYKAMAFIGLAACSMTFLFMIKHYGKASFRQSQDEASLKAALNIVYHETAINRLNLHSLSKGC